MSTEVMPEDLTEDLPEDLTEDLTEDLPEDVTENLDDGQSAMTPRPAVTGLLFASLGLVRPGDRRAHPTYGVSTFNRYARLRLQSLIRRRVACTVMSSLASRMGLRRACKRRADPVKSRRSPPRWQLSGVEPILGRPERTACESCAPNEAVEAMYAHRTEWPAERRSFWEPGSR